jgi:hypothetical protein
MVIEKQAIPQPLRPEEEIELELVQQEIPEETEVTINPDGTVSIGAEEENQITGKFGENLAEVIEDNELNSIAQELIQSFEEDLDSRNDWFRTYSEGLDLLGINSDNRTEPFIGASGVHHPILAEAVTQFQAQAYKEMLPAGGPVDTEVLGVTDNAKLEKANRVKNFMNYQITYKME